MPEPDVIIWVVEEVLSDGSRVQNINLSSETIQALTEDDADDLAHAIADAINNHSNKIAVVMHG